MPTPRRQVAATANPARIAKICSSSCWQEGSGHPRLRFTDQTGDPIAGGRQAVPHLTLFHGYLYSSIKSVQAQTDFFTARSWGVFNNDPSFTDLMERLFAFTGAFFPNVANLPFLTSSFSTSSPWLQQSLHIQHHFWLQPRRDLNHHL